MSVDARLRAGLGLNASIVVPPGEDRLLAVHRRHRRRAAAVSAAWAGAAVASVALVLGLAPGADEAAPPEPAQPVGTDTDAPAPAAGQLPDSTWRKVVTTRDALAAGVSRARVRDDIGPDGRLPLELRLAGDTFTQTGLYSGPAWEVGDSGTIAYDGRGRLVVTSEQCAECPALTLSWRVVRGRLEVTRVAPSTGPMAAVVWRGTWRRTD